MTTDIEYAVDETLDRCMAYRLLRVAYAALLVLVVLAVSPYTPQPAGDLKVAIYQIGASILLAIFLIHAVVSRHTFQRPPLLMPFAIALLVMFAIAALASEHVLQSVFPWSKWASLVVLYAVATQIYRSERSIRVLLLTVCIAVALSSLYALAQRAGYPDVPWAPWLDANDAARQLSGTFDDANAAGHALAIAFILALYLATIPGMSWCLALAILFAAHMVVTEQRSSAVAVVAAALLVLLTIGVRRFTSRPSLVVAGVVLVIAAIAGTGIAAVAAWAQGANGIVAPINESLRLRYNAYESAVGMIQEKPVLGYGPGNYSIAHVPFRTPYEHQQFATHGVSSPHVFNDFVEAAVDAGLPGGILYVLFVALAVAGGIYLYARIERTHERRLALALAAVFAAFAADSLVGFPVHTPVAAVLLFALAGALDGLFAGTLPPRTVEQNPERGFFWPAVLGTAAIVNVLFAGAVFASEVYLQRGHSAQQRQDYATAENALKLGAQLAPWSSEFPYRQAIVAASQGKMEEATPFIQRALVRNPYHIPAITNLAQNEFNRGASVLMSRSPDPAVVSQADELLSQAERHAGAALALCPSWAQSHDLLGRIDFVRGVHDRATSADPNRPQGTSDTYWRSAIEHFERALANGIEARKEPLRLIAQIHLVLGETEAAAGYLIQAADADIEDSTTWPTFWEYAQATGDYVELQDALERRIQRLSTSQESLARRAAADAYSWLIRIHTEHLHDPGKAAAAHCERVTLDPLREDYWNAYAYFAQKQDLHSEFLSCIESLAANADPSTGLLPQVAAVALGEHTTPESAARATSLLADLVRASANQQELAARGIDWAAPIVLQQVQALDSDTLDAARARALLGEVFQAMEQHETARELLAAAIPHLAPPESSATTTRLAAVLQALERPNDAVQVLKTAVARDPNDGRLHLAYARALATAARNAEARLEYQSILTRFALDDSTRAEVQKEMNELPAVVHSLVPGRAYP